MFFLGAPLFTQASVHVRSQHTHTHTHTDTYRAALPVNTDLLMSFHQGRSFIPKFRPVSREELDIIAASAAAAAATTAKGAGGDDADVGSLLAAMFENLAFVIRILHSSSSRGQTREPGSSWRSWQTRAATSCSGEGMLACAGAVRVSV